MQALGRGRSAIRRQRSSWSSASGRTPLRSRSSSRRPPHPSQSGGVHLICRDSPQMSIFFTDQLPHICMRLIDIVSDLPRLASGMLSTVGFTMRSAMHGLASGVYHDLCPHIPQILVAIILARLRPAKSHGQDIAALGTAIAQFLTYLV